MVHGDPPEAVRNIKSGSFIAKRVKRYVPRFQLLWSFEVGFSRGMPDRKRSPLFENEQLTKPKPSIPCLLNQPSYRKQRSDPPDLSPTSGCHARAKINFNVRVGVSPEVASTEAAAALEAYRTVGPTGYWRRLLGIILQQLEEG